MVRSLNSHAKDLERFWPGKIMWHCPLARFTTLRVGGPAEAVVFADDTTELARLLTWLRDHDIQSHVIGNGSNILAPDEGLAGVIIILSQKLAAIETAPAEAGRVLIKAGAACKLAKLSHYCADRAFSGLEFITGIPGTVGGAIAMNAGCWGYEISDVLDSATMLDAAGKLISVPREKLLFSYRQLTGCAGAIIVSGTFRLAEGDQEQIRTTCREYNKRRQEKQPQRVASAGSFFKNPPGQAAGKLIEDAGLKGRRVGGAMISDLHANFIINTGAATAADIIDLMRLVQHEVHAMSGIMLEPEVQILKDGGNCL
jgi:UDP-N-acetylmuramate dehydrogenase